MKVETLNLIVKIIIKKLFCSLIFTWLISGDVGFIRGGDSLQFRMGVYRPGSQILPLFMDETDENWYPILGQNLKNETKFKGKTKPKNLMETLVKSLW